MKHHATLLLVGGLALAVADAMALGSRPGPSSRASTQPATASMRPTIASTLPAEEEIDRLIAPLVDERWCASVTVGVITPGGVRVRGYGAVGDAAARPPDGRTVYEIGSVSKVFTSLLLAQLAEEGKLNLDDPVQRHLPDSVHMPRQGEKSVTLLQLATHTSGLPRMPGNFHPKAPANPYADFTVERLYEFLTACRPARAPGEGFEYSNLGAGLLGHALARAAGMEYERLLIDRIAVPLAMSNTRITLTADMRRRLAPPHDADNEPAANWDFPTLAGAGGIRSTVAELLRFLAAQMDLPQPGGLGRKAGEAGQSRESAAGVEMRRAIDITHRPRAAVDGRTKIALGWHMDAKYGFLWHNGQTGGYHSYVGFSPEAQVGVVVLANTATGVVDQAAAVLLLRTLGHKADAPVRPAVIALDRKTLDRRAGVYALPRAMTVVTITRDDDRLYARLTGQPRLRIYPHTTTTFFWKAVDAELTFIPADGVAGVDRLVIHQNRSNLTAFRIPAHPTDPPK